MSSYIYRFKYFPGLMIDKANLLHVINFMRSDFLPFFKE